MTARSLRITRLGPIATAIVAALALAACGSSGSGGSAQSLLKKTFSNSRSVKSGVLGFALTVTPTGSSVIKTPIALSVSGPFQSRGKGQLPISDLTLAFSGLGQKGSLGVISTGTAAYANLEGVNYQLPAADFKKLQSSFTSTSGSSAPGLSTFGIDPLHWLTNPKKVGTATIGGAATTHIRAGVDVPKLIADLNTFLAKQKAGSTGQIPPATAQKIATAVKNPTVDIWTGQSDSTLRKLALNVTVPVTGNTSTQLGGLTSAGVGLTVQYSDLNKPQSVPTPTSVHPYSEFTTKLQQIGQSLQSLFGGSTSTSGTSGSTGTGTTGSGAGSAGLSKYSQCIEQAGGNVTKMQKCASLLPSSGG